MERDDQEARAGGQLIPKDWARDESIVGTWRLIKTLARNDAGETMHPPYGPKPRGLVVFYPDRRMMSVLCDGRSELPPGETVREYNSYCGNYEYDGEIW